MSVPAVVLRATASTDAVVDGKTGRIVAPEDSIGFVDALAGYLEDPDLCARQGRPARSRAESDSAQRPLWDALAARYDALSKVQQSPNG